MKRLLSPALVCALLCLCGAILPYTARADGYIDNSDVMPRYRPDSEVTLLDDGSPDWLTEAIIAEVRIETCNGSHISVGDGDFEDARRVIDHYAQTGVNVIWFTPIVDRPKKGEPGEDGSYHGYYGYGPHTFAESVSGSSDYAQSKLAYKDLIDYAHSKNVRILMDVVTWGVHDLAPLVTEHPEYFSGRSHWGGPAFNWSSPDTVQYFVDTLVDLAVTTGVDGFRADCEPNISGYAMFGRVREELYRRGRKVAIVAEGHSTRTSGGELVYDLDTWGVNASDGSVHGVYSKEFNQIFYQNSIVDLIKQGREIGLPEIWQKGGKLARFYTMQASCHDHDYIKLQGNAVHAGYSFLFTPFIPLFHIGEEWNGRAWADEGYGLYCNMVHWEMLNKNREFFETFKKYIRIRRTYSDIFEYFAPSVTDANICAVTTSKDGKQPQSYARFANGRAVVIVPNVDDAFKSNVTVTVPWEAAGLTADTYAVTDLLSGKQLALGTKDTLTTFKASVPEQATGVYLIEPITAPTETTAVTAATTATTAATAAPTTVPPTTVPPTTVPPTTTASVTVSSASSVTNDRTAPTASAAAPTQVQTEAPADGVPVGTVLGIAAAAVVAAVAVLLVFGKKKP